MALGGRVSVLGEVLYRRAQRNERPTTAPDIRRVFHGNHVWALAFFEIRVQRPDIHLARLINDRPGDETDAVLIRTHA